MPVDLSCMSGLNCVTPHSEEGPLLGSTAGEHDCHQQVGDKVHPTLRSSHWRTETSARMERFRRSYASRTELHVGIQLHDATVSLMPFAGLHRLWKLTAINEA